jgi:hypothetical protein
MSALPAGLLPSQPTLRVQQTPGKPRKEQLAKSDHLIVLLPEKPATSLWRQVPEGLALQSLAKKRKLAGQPLRTRMKNSAGTGITLGQLKGSGKGAGQTNSFDLLTYSGSLAADAL